MVVTISKDVSEKIEAICNEWNSASAALKALLAGWARRSAAAGLERGAMVQIGQLAGDDLIAALGLDSDDPQFELEGTGQFVNGFEAIGSALYVAYKRGAVVETIRSLGIADK